MIEELLICFFFKYDSTNELLTCWYIWRSLFIDFIWPVLASMLNTKGKLKKKSY